MATGARATTRTTLVRKSTTAVHNCCERVWLSGSASSWLLCAGGSALLVLSIVYLQAATSSDSASIRFQGVANKTKSDSIELELIMWERSKELEASLVNITSAKKLHDKTTPQGKAFDWLVISDKLQLTASSNHLVQRYILAVLYYSTAGHQWSYAKKVWLSQKHECYWSEEVKAGSSNKRGVFQCDKENRVRYLQLRKSIGVDVNAFFLYII